LHVTLILRSFDLTTKKETLPTGPMWTDERIEIADSATGN